MNVSDPAQHLCSLTELQKKGSLGVEREHRGEQLALFLVADDNSVRAYRDRCPHRGTPLAWTPDRYLDARGEHLICATHGALFRIEDGYCIAGPCLGARLEPVDVVIDGDDILFASD